MVGLEGFEPPTHGLEKQFRTPRFSQRIRQICEMTAIRLFYSRSDCRVLLGILVSQQP